MKINQYILTILFIVPVIIAGTMNTYSKIPVDVKLTSHFNVTYCENEIPRTEVLVTVGLGEIKRTDSLYGFNFAIKYDRSKLYFNSAIKSNTLSEFASYADVSFGLEYGKLFGAAINDYPLSGNKELIGFFGDYVGNLCNDSALIEIEYIEFTDEFQKEVSKLDTIWIKPTRAALNYSISPNFATNEYKYDTIITNVLPLELNTKNVKYLDYVGFNISSQNDAYDIKFTNIDKDYVVSEINHNENSFDLILQNINGSNVKSNINLLDLEIFRKINETDTVSKIIVKPIKLSDCNCFDDAKVSSDSIRIDYIKSKTTSVIENNNLVKIDFNNNVLNLSSNNVEIIKFQLFNLVGSIIKEENIYKDVYNCNLELTNGVYLLNVITNKQIIRKKILINN